MLVLLCQFSHLIIDQAVLGTVLSSILWLTNLRHIIALEHLQFAIEGGISLVFVLSLQLFGVNLLVFVDNFAIIPVVDVPLLLWQNVKSSMPTHL